MDTFSERFRFKPKRNMQIRSMDDGLRNKLWNILLVCFWRMLQEYDRIDYDQKESNSEKNNVKSLVKLLWFSHFKKPFNELYGHWPKDYQYIKERFFSYHWYEVYDFLEFIARRYKNNSTLEEFINFCNNAFEEEFSAYRFVGLTIVAITSETEIEAIEEALMYKDKLMLVSIHIEKALIHLSDRENPDYRNSIKESISAVESICCLVSDKSNTTLGEALNTIEKNQKVDLHPALSGAFKKLYGYTNDANGIRHALSNKSNLDFEDAKFMLVSCSAFINYLKGKAIKAGVNFTNQ
jgi:uncharacterized protein with PIN domain